jgi:hypothetical protein
MSRRRKLDSSLRCNYSVRARVLMSAVPLLAGAAVATVPAAAKDGVHATLTTKVPLDAEPGTALRIGWKLAYVEEGEPHPFGASGVFVRLGSASGAASKTGFAEGDRGTFTATVTVPEGGIGDVEIGLRGYTSGVRSGQGDMLFPIANDPLPGKPRVASPPSDPPTPTESGGTTRPWMLFVAVLLLLAIAAVGACARRRTARRPRAATGRFSEPPPR